MYHKFTVIVLEFSSRLAYSYASVPKCPAAGVLFHANADCWETKTIKKLDITKSSEYANWGEREADAFSHASPAFTFVEHHSFPGPIQ